MRRYLVEAFSKAVVIEDLNLVVAPNQPKTISEESYKSSVCLGELVKRGQLRVSRTSLCREEVIPKVPKKKKTLKVSPPKGFVAPPETAPLAEEPVPRKVSKNNDYLRKEDLVEIVSAAVTNAVRSTVVALQGLSQIPAPQSRYEAPARVSPRSSSRVEEDLPLPEEIPIFIPTGLVPKETSGEITVTSQSQSSEDLGDSAAALKKLRKGATK